ncbi:hypothetical protein IMW63_00570 [Ehrlichia ruminantium]|uniref:hypothetical protein n=1 Tax=Ehrlichia ruminantium TaxID=779 RepID=UPI001FB1DE44|nr:hypothetical protein [Ehrlichia ruminantium]UOD98882.1 hypothetical protein IMW63_00570 [Ehrlichia ruminantium]
MTNGECISSSRSFGTGHISTSDVHYDANPLLVKDGIYSKGMCLVSYVKRNMCYL